MGTALSYHPSIIWIDKELVTNIVFKDSDNLFVGDPVSFNSGAEACNAGTTDDITFMGLCLSKYTTALNSSADKVIIAIVSKARPTLSSAATTVPGQMFIFGNDGRGTMLSSGSASQGYGWALEYASSSVSTPIIYFNAIMLSSVATHLFEDPATS